MAVMVEEQQRMAAELKAANKWIKDSEKIIADQTARIVDLQTHIENHVCSQRPWVGLTEEEKFEIAAEQHGWEDLLIAAEAKLKERNNA